MNSLSSIEMDLSSSSTQETNNNQESIECIKVNEHKPYRSEDFILSLNVGDRFDVFDEERGWWQTATMTLIDAFNDHIDIQFDENTDGKYSFEDPQANIGDEYVGGSSDHFDFAPVGKFTVLSTEPLNLPFESRFVANSEITLIRDGNGDEMLVFNLRAMDNEETTARTEGIGEPILVVFDPKTKAFRDRNFISNDIEKIKLKYLSDEYWNSLIGECSNGMEKVYVAKTKQYHVIGHDVNVDNNGEDPFSFHSVYQVHGKEMGLVPGYDRHHITVPALGDGKLVYVAACDKLMYFGGFDSECEWSQDIWSFDLDGNGDGEWKLMPYKLPNDEDSFSVICAGELLFIFYSSDSCRDIYIYCTFDGTSYKLSKQFPCPYKGDAVAIKTGDDWVHFINSTEYEEDYLMETDRPYHFRLKLDELIPAQLRKKMDQRRKDLIYFYVDKELNRRYNGQLSTMLLSHIQNYYSIL